MVPAPAGATQVPPMKNSLRLGMGSSRSASYLRGMFW